MAPKRNDPCYCGSGKKYKHCHLPLDRKRESEARSEQAVDSFTGSAPPLPVPPLLRDASPEPGRGEEQEAEEVDPEVERLNQLFEEFQAADYEEKIAILQRSIEEKALDGGLAFEFFNTLHPLMVERGEREEFDELVAALRASQPDVYAEENHWFWSWEVHNALVLEDDEALERATDQLIQNGGQDLDQFYPVLRCLLYHDRREELLAAMNKHQPEPTPGKYFPNVEYELNQKLSDVMVMDYLERHDRDDVLRDENFEALCAKVERYVEDLLRDGLADFLSRASGRVSDSYALADFLFRPKPKRGEWIEGIDEDEEEAEDPAAVALRNLGSEFLHYAHEVESVPFTKAELARRNLVLYVLERDRGELEERRSMWDAPKSKRKADRSTSFTNVLLPDHATLDRYLTRFFGFLSMGTYEGAAFFELIPTWSRFLQAKGLVAEEEAHAALRSMQALSQSMVQLMEKFDTDPVLAANMGAWRENAGT